MLFDIFWDMNSGNFTVNEPYFYLPSYFEVVIHYLEWHFVGLPWKPKVRQKDIDLFLETARMKFVGYTIEGDCDSLAGLPQPIHEGVKTLKEVPNHTPKNVQTE